MAITKSWGRIEWMPRLKLWKVVRYIRYKEVVTEYEIGRFATKEEALAFRKPLLAARRQLEKRSRKS